jgi:mono/diheme cytochrome c family protein
MKRRTIMGVAPLALVMFWLSGCGSPSFYAPPVTAQLVRAAKRENVDSRTLTSGRSLFLNRCIQCHALPEVRQFSAPQLTAIVGKMSGRANMSAEQHEAVLKYLLTIRSL